MNIDKFWQKVDDIRAIYHSKYRHAILTDDEQLVNIIEFLSDMDALTSEWYSWDGKRDGLKIIQKGISKQ